MPGIRAALTHDTYSADRAAKSNNAQIITMGARVIGPELAKAIVDTWLAAQFDPKGPLRRKREGESTASTRNTPRRLPESRLHIAPATSGPGRKAGPERISCA